MCNSTVSAMACRLSPRPLASVTHTSTDDTTHADHHSGVTRDVR